jgi:hypothetical protein
MLKAHVPVEQYGFIEVEGSDIADIVKKYKEVQYAFGAIASDDLRERDFNKILDKYLMTNTMEADVYEGLTVKQKECIQTLKRAFKRINNQV